MKTSYPKTIEQIVSSQNYILGVVFVKPRSQQWPLVRAMLVNSDIVVEEGDMTIAIFGPSEKSLQTINNIYPIVANWKSIHYFSRGKKIYGPFDIKWLNCYLKAMRCNDKRAYCHAVVLSPGATPYFPAMLNINIISDGKKPPPDVFVAPEKYIVPCSYAKSFHWADVLHPSELRDQFQARAVELGVSDCPLFDLSAFKKADS